MITAVLPVVFTSSFNMKTPNQTSVGKEVCRLFGRRKHVARHRNYRLGLSLRSRYRQKSAYREKLPPYGITTEKLPLKNGKPPTAEKLPPYGITAEKRPLYFGFTASAKVVTAKKRKTAYRREITAVWRYRPACVRLTKRYRR